jgi:hypothetical protein
VDNPAAWDVAYLNGRPLPGLARLEGEGFAQRFDSKGSPGADGATHTFLGREASEFKLTLLMWLPEHLEQLRDAVRQVTPKRVVPRPSPSAPAPRSPEPAPVGEDFFVAFARDTARTGLPAAYNPPFRAGEDLDGVGVGGSAPAPSPLRPAGAPGPSGSSSTPSQPSVTAVTLSHPSLAIFGLSRVVVQAIGLPESDGKGAWKCVWKLRQYVPNNLRTNMAGPTRRSVDIANGIRTTPGLSGPTSPSRGSVDP